MLSNANANTKQKLSYLFLLKFLVLHARQVEGGHCDAGEVLRLGLHLSQKTVNA